MRIFGFSISLGVAVARLLGLALILALIGLRIADPVFVSTIRNQSFDFLQRLKPRPQLDQPIVIVDIDERSLQQVGQWPWPRSEVAALVDRLTAMGAIAIGFDVVFAEPDRLSPDRIAADNPDLPESVRAGLAALPSNEEVMADAVRRSRVIVGETSARGSEVAEAGGQGAIADTPYAALGSDPLRHILHFQKLVQNIKIISDAAAGHGVFTVDPDPDGVFRRMPLVMVVEKAVRLGLSAEILRIATGGQAFATRADEAGLTSIVVGGVAVPTDGQGKVWPWFNASRRDRYVSAGAVLSGEAPVQSIAGHMVLIGTSAVGLEDFRATPVATFMPGVEIHAQIMENILGQQLLSRPNYAIGMEIVFIALFGLLIVWLVPKLGAAYASVAAISVLAVFAGGSLWAFTSERMLIDATFPFASLTALFMVMATANYLREERQKREIRRAFGQYLSPSLVDRLADDPSRLVLGGETRDLTLLFTDVRGFTTISESYKAFPQGLTRLMNRFLTALSQPILERDGTIDKYMGDAIMAFWNAPVDLPDHAARACRAALDMIRKVDDLNEKMLDETKANPDQPYHRIKIGIGINTGTCVVGNMGSDMRFDYTALGDTVNLASRLEGQSKPYGLSVILGDGTAQTVAAELATIEIDLIRVKGKTEPERIHALLGEETLARSEGFLALRRVNGDMLESYRGQRWEEARGRVDAMAPLAAAIGADLDDYLDLCRSRIDGFVLNPPGQDWDGVYTATSK
jgi:adenylate cyclase